MSTPEFETPPEYDDDPVLASRDWVGKTKLPRHVDMSDPAFHDEIMTFERPRGLIRRGQDLAWLAGKVRFWMMMVIAMMFFITGVILIIDGTTTYHAFVIPTITVICALGLTTMIALFAYLTHEERTFTRALARETQHNADLLDLYAPREDDDDEKHEGVVR